MKTVSTTKIIANEDDYKKCFKCGRIHLNSREICKWCGHKNFIQLDSNDFKEINSLREKLKVFTMEV